LAEVLRPRHRAEPSSEFATLHRGLSIPGTCNEKDGISSGQRPCSGCQTAFHTYALEWDQSVSPQQLRWYLDGVNFYTIRQDQVDAASWTAFSSGQPADFVNLNWFTFCH
jgi:hypothetical protein